MIKLSNGRDLIETVLLQKQTPHRGYRTTLAQESVQTCPQKKMMSFLQDIDVWHYTSPWSYPNYVHQAGSWIQDLVPKQRQFLKQLKQNETDNTYLQNGRYVTAGHLGKTRVYQQINSLKWFFFRLVWYADYQSSFLIVIRCSSTNFFCSYYFSSWCWHIPPLSSLSHRADWNLWNNP